MPVVRRYESPRVGRNQLPSVRLSADAPSSAFQPVKSIDFGPAMGIAADFIQREQDKADQVAFTAAEAKASQLETELLHGQNGVLYREGKNAFSAPEEVSEAWTKGVSAITSELKTPRQKQAFERAVSTRWNSINAQVQRHVASERNKFDTEESQNLINAESDAAVKNYNDPERVQLALGRTVAAVKDFAARQGWGEETLHQAVSKTVSNIHSGVINAMLGDDHDIAAEEYYKQHADQISGEQTVRIKNALEEGSLRGKSQRESDKIVSQNQDEGAALEQARQIEDPKLRDEVERRVKSRFVEQRAVDRDRENDAYISAANYIDARKSGDARSAVPPALWNSLKPTQRRSLEIYADRSNGGGGGGSSTSGSSTNAWLDFLDLDTDEVAELTRSEFETRYLSRLGKREGNRAITRWKNARDGRTANGAEEKRTFTLADDIKGSLKSANLIPSFNTSQLDKDQKKILASVEADVEEARYEFANRNGKKPSPSDERLMVDQAVMKAFFKNNNGTLRLHADGGSVAISKTRFGSPKVSFNSIPQGRRNVLADEGLRRYGKRPTNDQIERAYAASLMNDENGVDAALRK